MNIITRGVACVAMTAVCIGSTMAAYPIGHMDFPQNSDLPLIMTIDGTDVYADEFAANMAYNKSYYESYAASMGQDATSMWGTDDAMENLRAAAKDMTFYLHEMQTKFDEEGLKLTNGDSYALRAEREQLISDLGGEAAFRKRLKETGYSEQMFTNLNLASTYGNLLKEHYFGVGGTLVPSEDELRKQADENYYNIKYIVLYLTDQTNGETLDDAAKAEQRQKAEEALKKAQSGEDFDELIKSYSDAPEFLTQYPDGMTISKTDVQADEELAAAIENVKVDSVSSELVEVGIGYLIIQNLPISDENYDSIRSDLAETAAGVTFDEMQQQWMDDADITTTEAYTAFSLNDISKYNQ